MLMYAQEISRAIRELTNDLTLGALDSTGYESRASRVAEEADEILRSGTSSFTLRIAERELRFPIVRFGPTITSMNLFDYKELSVFAIYGKFLRESNQFLDLGSNIGSHSLFAASLGATVRSWEPDRSVSSIQREMFRENGFTCTQVDAAAGAKFELATFVHLDDNQTGSHLVGKKSDPYGRTTSYEVQVEDCRQDIQWADLVKMDVEGSESEILCQTSYNTLSEVFIICEVTDNSAASDLYEYLSSAPVSMYSQRSGWRIPKSAHDLPSHHSHGSLLILGHESSTRNCLGSNFDELLRSNQ